ncbi:MAG: hypothetical protein ACR5LC_05770 [Symbiopectobacterium sp.]|uniref:hypothetical protein n=1 Tax=Symbiopectobacterium sp. TaxID=2952789 RepID=UPI003F4043B1
MVDPIAPPIPQPNAGAVYSETASLPVEPENEPEETPKAALPPVQQAAQGKSALRRWWWIAPSMALAGALVWQFRTGVPGKPIISEPVVAHTRKNVYCPPRKNPKRLRPSHKTPHR